MKYFSALLFAAMFFCNNVIFALAGHDPLLVVVIMVKDDADVIKPTLEIYCKADPENKKIAYLIYDVGPKSYSPTMEKAEELFQEYSVANYYIIQEPYVDGAASRNRALDMAEKQFPNAEYMLMPDAGWYLQGVEILLNFCEKELQFSNHTAYLIKVVGPKKEYFYLTKSMVDTLEHLTIRLLRTHSGIRFAGPVWEYVQVEESYKIPDSIYFEDPEYILEDFWVSLILS